MGEGMPAQTAEALCAQTRQGRRAQVLLNPCSAAHAGNDRRNGWMSETEAQGETGKITVLGRDFGLQSTQARFGGTQALGGEPAAAPVAVREAVTLADRPGEQALLEGHAHDDAGAGGEGGGEEALGRPLLEEVVDHLHAVDQSGSGQTYGVVGIPVVDRDTEGADLPIAFQALGGGFTRDVVYETR